MPAGSGGDFDDKHWLVLMHPDRKIGIAMGILLIGVVAALFFRNEPLQVDDALSVRRKRELNERLRERDVAVYLSGEVDGEITPEEQDWSLSEVFETTERTDEALPILVKEANSDRVSRVVEAPPAFTPPVQPERSEKKEMVEQPAANSRGHAIAEVQPPATDTSAEPNSTTEFSEYTIQYGDTLSGISKRFLGSHHRYSELYRANKDRIDNPDRLRVGTAIRIPRTIH